ncbi:hypothetical protein [Marinobacterium weihaiense]|uniref:Transcriptional regulator n=1 Tax=Marinobacterium weihaiense TaxID=2851016 RepID=A0ABS6MA55_9GAMM|nr:hypothetical protein [Marinobacterium weihaiense]MBV0933174.1 hypothetical protein [Marinobacterium weihaiense]
MTAHQNFAQADHCFTIKQVDDNSWWVLRSDLPRHGRRSILPRVVFFGTSEEQVKSWLDSRSEPFFLQQ